MSASQDWLQSSETWTRAYSGSPPIRRSKPRLRICNGRLFRDDVPVINDVGLAALAPLGAESEPKDKEVMIRLVMNMLAPPID